MTKSFFVAGIAAAALCAMPLVASAVPTLNLLDSSTQGVGNTADIFGADFDGTTPLGATWSGAAPVVTPPPGNANGSFQSPFNNTGLVGTQSYFSVGGSNGGNGGSSPMTLTYDSLQDNFTFLWGSIDSYNEIEFFDANGVSLGGSTGSGVIAALNLPGSPNNFEQVALLEYVFGANEMFKSVTFTSSSAAFEFALPAAVPLPAAAWMLISAIAGLGFVSSRRRRSAAA
ncbi:VPLPA-CTERM sorting domain-containing protein [Pikeienuella sp. HZG-20]|uniref:Npun_F0296 family exosortase-dependent surface protein n=1 Tax=Paludibacillus litoralis TaxID=3133267 RepID=UPI0030EC869D